MGLLYHILYYKDPDLRPYSVWECGHNETQFYI